MHFFLAFFLAASFHVFDLDWTVPDIADWQMTGAGSAAVLRLATGKEPPPDAPRRPQQFALAQTNPFSKVSVAADVKPLGSSLIIVFAYRDPAHFNYAHLSVDSAVKQPHHNGIFHVYGGERVRISSDAGPAAFSVTQRWYRVLLTYGEKPGEVTVTVDGKPVPALHAVDLSLTSGRVGLGSFDETAEFRNVRISE